MASERIEQSSIWLNSLGQKDKKCKKQLERLRSSLSNMRNKAAMLTAQIASDFKQLTQHEVSHLDALWETASVIAGDNYNINPLEGYILGAVILLHDSALSFAAYEGGIKEIRATEIWLDLYEENKKKLPYQIYS